MALYCRDKQLYRQERQEDEKTNRAQPSHGNGGGEGHGNGGGGEGHGNGGGGGRRVMVKLVSV